VQHGTPWCLQWLLDHGADVALPDYAGLTPEETIWRNSRLHNNEMEWCFQAVRGELTEKNSQKAQEYRLVKNRSTANDKSVTEKLDREMLKMRKFWFNTGDYKLPYIAPTPEELAGRPLDLPSSKVAPRLLRKTPLPVALLFPGEGSQYVGMLKDVVDKPSVQQLLGMAADILGWDPKDLCLNGPEAKLSETKYCQPIMFIAGLAAWNVLAESNKQHAERLQAVAGLSLGEYTAICVAGVLTPEDGLQLVQLRAEAMQRASQEVPQATCSVAGLDRQKVEILCEEAKKVSKHKPAECTVSNSLFPSGLTCGGHKECIKQLCKSALQARALQAKEVKSGGAFHTSLMQSAQDEFDAALDDFLPKMKPPRFDIYFNASGRKVKAGTDPAEFLHLMKAQLTSEVMWENIIKAMIVDSVKHFFEVGPLKQLKSIMKRIDADAFRGTENISV
jgi:[acyl-carrier-protein] S-malonyltransferase